MSLILCSTIHVNVQYAEHCQVSIYRPPLCLYHKAAIIQDSIIYDFPLMHFFHCGIIFHSLITCAKCQLLFYVEKEYSKSTTLKQDLLILKCYKHALLVLMVGLITVPSNLGLNTGIIPLYRCALVKITFKLVVLKRQQSLWHAHAKCALK